MSVLATVSAASTDEEEHNNVVLTAAESGTRLDSLQHNQNWNRPAGIGTSVGFGGKSRYLAIGDDSGAVCLWDLKKVRKFSFVSLNNKKYLTVLFFFSP